MKRFCIVIFVILAATLSLASCTGQPQNEGNMAEAIAAEFRNPKSTKVLVASHRGDWRNWPENSIPAIESVIEMGVDIVEIDLKLTSDSILVLCHDKTIDRTTTGKGRISDIPYDSIAHCFLKTGHNVKTELKMPTLTEALEVCKDRIMVNVDQGYEYYDLVLAETERLGVTGQVLIKGKKSTDVVDAKFAEYPDNMLYMPIIDILKPQGKALFAEYMDKGIVPLAYEVCWDEMTPEVEDCMKKIVETGSKLWVNSLWPSLCGGLCDDAAYVCDVDEVYGKLIGMGATLIQTDRPESLLDYLKAKGLHD